MKKTLNDLTKEDWNTLFPIKLVDHNPEWKNIYKGEEERILKKVGNEIILRIEHFGSSSIPSIKSKPYIDLMIEISKKKLFNENLIASFTELGYSHFVVPARENIEAYSSFGKGYNIDGIKEQIFHIHMCPKDNVMWKQIGFRDFLNSNPERAKQYESLKLRLASKFKNDRGSYILGKTDFVNETLEIINGKANAQQKRV
ncbi:MAG: GrpB family protein [Cellulophaga sp.]